jgi:pyridoxal phosphate phosphatase PHOSPHO2
MRNAFKHAFEKKADILIISDANTFYISTITRAKEIDSYIMRTITNPAVFDAGRVSIQRHTVEPHGCLNGCALNLCKGNAN